MLYYIKSRGEKAEVSFNSSGQKHAQALSSPIRPRPFSYYDDPMMPPFVNHEEAPKDHKIQSSDHQAVCSGKPRPSIEPSPQSLSNKENAAPDLSISPSSSQTSQNATPYKWYRQPSFQDPGPPPDLCLKSYLQVLGGFITVFLCWGLINSFGLFQTYYKTHLTASPSDISWIGTSQIFLLMLIGAYSGSASDSGYFRLVSFIGATLFVFGVFMTSLSRTYYQLLLSHGVCTGVGMGFIFIPTMSVVSTYWSAKHRTLALGCMLCGAAVGGIVFPEMFDRSIKSIGFPWAMRVFGFIAATGFGIAQALLRKRLPPKQGQKVLEFDVLKDGVFVLFVVGSFVNFLGLYFAFFYISAYARDVLRLEFSRANKLLLLINGCGIPGRLLPMWLADQRQWPGVRPVTVQVPLILVSGVALFAWIGIDSERGLFVFAAVYGFAANAVQSLFPATLADMTLDPRKVGAQIGWGFTIGSLSCLTGNPIGGALIQAAGGKYLYAQVYGGTSLILGCGLISIVVWLRMRQQKRLDAA